MPLQAESSMKLKMKQLLESLLKAHLGTVTHYLDLHPKLALIDNWFFTIPAEDGKITLQRLNHRCSRCQA